MNDVAAVPRVALTARVQPRTFSELTERAEASGRSVGALLDDMSHEIERVAAAKRHNDDAAMQIFDKLARGAISPMDAFRDFKIAIIH